MLDKILAAELLPVALEKYIEPYMCRHRLEKDEILLQYIKVEAGSRLRLTLLG